MAKPKDSLTPQFIEIFCREYFINRNIKRSCMAAGWSESTAWKNGYQVLANVGVQKELARLNEIELEKHDEVKAKIWAEYKKIAFTDVSEMFTYDDQGRARPIPMNEMTPDQRSLIANMRSKIKFDRDGQPWYDFELIMHDKMKALEKMGQMIGAFREVVDNNINVVDFEIAKKKTDGEEPTPPAIPEV